MNTLLIALALAVPLVPHDFFISVLTMQHKAEQRTLDLTWQITAHDLEHALSNVAELKLNSALEHPQADSLINAYFEDHLHLSLGNRSLDWNWIGREMEGENLFCYLQVENVGSVNGLAVSNTLLQDVFQDQDNIVHVEDGVQVLTHHFLSGGGTHTFGEE
jgi:hypothetical protein